MDKAPKVSILVPVYRVEDYIEAALDSILAQTLENIEVICLDEGEDDACYEILLEYAERDPRIRVVHRPHGGYGPALTAGLDMAIGEYIGFVDPDDTILPRMYSELYDYAKYIGADVVKSPWIQRGRDGWESVKLPIYEFPKWRTFSASEFPQIFALHPSIWAGLYKRDFLLRHKITFTNRMFSDQKFRMRTLLETDRVGWYDKPFYKYTMDREGSATLNWNIGLMTEVWLEIHRSVSQEIFKKISQFLILEENLCVFGRVNLSDICKRKDEKLFFNIKSCLDYTSNVDIKNSPVLNLREKRYLLRLKSVNSINDLTKMVRRRRNQFRRLLRFLGLRRRKS